MFREKKSVVLIDSASGFSLIELCIVIIISSLMLAAGLKLFNLYMAQQEIVRTNDRLERIQDVINDFAKANGFYPCPAPISVAPDSPGYATATNCAAAAPAGVTEVTGRGGRKVRIGALPARTLEMSDTYMADGWNHRYTYAVTVPLTNASTFDNDEGAITIRDINDNTVINGTAHYVLLSHGEDGKGSYSTGGGQFMACTATSGKDQDNCTNTTATFRVSQDRSTAPGSGYYDDFALYGTRIMLDPTEQIVYCSSLGKFYNPASPQADANGCTCPSGQTTDGGGFCQINVPACPPGQFLTSNGAGGVICSSVPAPTPDMAYICAHMGAYAGSGWLTAAFQHDPHNDFCRLIGLTQDR